MKSSALVSVPDAEKLVPLSELAAEHGRDQRTLRSILERLEAETGEKILFLTAGTKPRFYTTRESVRRAKHLRQDDEKEGRIQALERKMEKFERNLKRMNSNVVSMLKRLRTAGSHVQE